MAVHRRSSSGPDRAARTDLEVSIIGCDHDLAGLEAMAVARDLDVERRAFVEPRRERVREALRRVLDDRDPARE